MEIFMKDFKKIRTKNQLVLDIVFASLSVIFLFLGFILSVNLNVEDSTKFKILGACIILCIIFGLIGLKTDKKVKTFRCLNCGCHFQLDDTYVNHSGGWSRINSRHGGRLTFKCPACGSGTMSHHIED
jgi:transcription elongation factor Elf1